MMGWQALVTCHDGVAGIGDVSLAVEFERLSQVPADLVEVVFIFD